MSGNTGSKESDDDVTNTVAAASKKKDRDSKPSGKKGNAAAVPKGLANNMETPPNQPKENDVPTTKLLQFTRTFAF